MTGFDSRSVMHYFKFLYKSHISFVSFKNTDQGHSGSEMHFLLVGNAETTLIQYPLYTCCRTLSLATPPSPIADLTFAQSILAGWEGMLRGGLGLEYTLILGID